MASVGQQLIAAVEAGRVDEMKTLIAARANVEESDTVSLKMAHTVRFEMINGCGPGGGKSIEVRAQVVPAPDGLVEKYFDKISWATDSYARARAAGWTHVAVPRCAGGSCGGSAGAAGGGGEHGGEE